MVNWKEKTLGEVTSFITKGIPPKYSDYESESTIWVLNQKCNRNFEISYADARLHDYNLKKVPENKMLMNGDVLINSTGTGTAGRVAQLQNIKKPTTIDGHMILLRPTDDIDSLYYGYAIKSCQSQIEGLAEGSTGQTELNRKRLQDEIIIKYPVDKQQQKAIAYFLLDLDEKIKINVKINNNLEQQMRALFNEFLLVNHFNSLTTVEDAVLTANTGADAIQKAPIVDYDTGVRCIRVGDMTNNRSFHAWGFTKVTDDVFKRYQLHKDDIVVTRTASIGLNTIIAENLSAVYNNGLIRLTVNHSKILPLFLYRQFQTVDFTNYIARIESETSVRPNMKINYLLKYEFVLPPMDKQKELIDLLAPMLNQQNALITESKHLENLRDTLLPKLMSGEIDVSDIEI